MDEKEVLSEAEKEMLIKRSEIGLLITDYNEIFSDFDPRHYSERALSDDFLAEARKASRDKEHGTIELRFMLPPHKRNPREESVIKKRLREHFRKHFSRLEGETKNMIKQGIAFTLVGVVVMFTATALMFQNSNSFYASFLVVLLEPAGWFLFWEGSRQIMFEPKTKKPELEFYKKMSKCEIKFSSY